jgi:hypothetical protein
VGVCWGTLLAVLINDDDLLAISAVCWSLDLAVRDLLDGAAGGATAAVAGGGARGATVAGAGSGAG